MPDREFIHSASDVASSLLYALDSGFHVCHCEPQYNASPRMLTKAQARHLSAGVFLLLRPEWIFGTLQVSRITAGVNRGKYFVSPGVNCAPITLYFQGERIEKGHRRFGAGVVSFDRDWLELPAHVIRESPPELETWFVQILDNLLSDISIKAGAHRYFISRGVVSDPSAAQCLPPFDFIPWSEVALKKGKSKGNRN